MVVSLVFLWLYPLVAPFIFPSLFFVPFKYWGRIGSLPHVYLYSLRISVSYVSKGFYHGHDDKERWILMKQDSALVFVQY